MGMAFRIGVHRHVALVQMRHNGIRQRTRGLFVIGFAVGQFVLGDQHGDGRTMRLVILAGNVENIGTDDLDHVGQNLGQTLGVVHLVDVINIGFALFFGLRVTDVVDVEAQGFGQVVETVQLEFGFHAQPLREMEMNDHRERNSPCRGRHRLLTG